MVFSLEILSVYSSNRRYSNNIVFAAVMTFIILKVMKLFITIRVESAEEADGLDVAEHGETAYPAFTGLD